MATQFTPETIGNYFSPEEQQLIKGLSFQGGVSVLGGGMTQYFTSGGKQYAVNVPGGGDYVENYKAFLNAVKSGTSDKPVATPGVPIPTQTAGQPQAVSTIPPPSNQPQSVANQPQPVANPPPVPVTATPGYTGPSIVDYLKSVGQPSDFASRTQLANKRGIQNYTGTAEQNTSLLNQLRGANTAANGPNQAPGATSGYTSSPAIPGQDYAAYEVSQGFPQTGSQTTQGSQGAQVLGSETRVDPLQPLKDLLSSYGITPNVANAAANPLGTFDDVYKKVYDQLGLGDLKSHIDDLTKRLAENDQKISDKISNINSNPWLSEGIRLRQIASATKGNQLERSNILNELKLNEAYFEKGRGDARYAAHETITQLNQNRNFDLKELEYRINLAEKALEANQKLQERHRTGAETESRFERSQQATESRFQRSQEVRVQQKAEKTDVIGKLEKVLGNLKTLGQTRQEAEAKFKKDNGVSNIPANVGSIFDKVFGIAATQNKPWWQIW